jgi:hypothetical protein
MTWDRALTAALGLCCLLPTAASARDLTAVNPPFPRIANCYGAQLPWADWEKCREYVGKLDLVIGGCYDLHYDWDDPRWPGILARCDERIALLRELNPHLLVLPYVDVIEGPDNPAVPAGWWALNDKGERWSGWPGYLRVRTELPEVLQYNLDQVREKVLGREVFDGVFYDCWDPDPWLVPRTAGLRDGQAVVMVNAWNLPARGMEHLNGALAEDEINRIITGQVDFDEFLGRYLRWCRESRKPVTTTLVCHPRPLNDDPWRWAAMTHEERVAEADRAHRDDQQTMRFGLATTLLGDGYFGYDTGTMGRGNWWWYPEYDAPLGYPRGEATRNPDGTWQREYDGGTVVANGSAYDTVVTFADSRRDLSTGRVGRRFTLPMFDGRLFLPADGPDSPGADVEPRLTAQAPAAVRLGRLTEGLTVVQTPPGLELRLDDTGALVAIRWQGKRLLTGGFPQTMALPDGRAFTPADVQGGPLPLAPGATEAALEYHGRLVQGDQSVTYNESCRVREDGSFSLKFDFVADSELDIRLWRHYFFLPVPDYAGAEVSAESGTVALPERLGEEQLLGAARAWTIRAPQATIQVESSLPLGLVDHRKWGTQEYLLAGYPLGGKAAAGRTWTVEMQVRVSAPER